MLAVKKVDRKVEIIGLALRCKCFLRTLVHDALVLIAVIRKIYCDNVVEHSQRRCQTGIGRADKADDTGSWKNFPETAHCRKRDNHIPELIKPHDSNCIQLAGVGSWCDFSHKAREAVDLFDNRQW